MNRLMKEYRFKCATPYTLNGKSFSEGDITEDADMAISFHYLFEEIVSDERVDESMSKKDLQKFAEEHNMVLAKSCTKTQLINKINEILEVNE